MVVLSSCRITLLLSKLISVVNMSRKIMVSYVMWRTTPLRLSGPIFTLIGLSVFRLRRFTFIIRCVSMMRCGVLCSGLLMFTWVMRMWFTLSIRRCRFITIRLMRLGVIRVRFLRCRRCRVRRLSSTLILNMCALLRLSLILFLITRLVRRRRLGVIILSVGIILL